MNANVVKTFKILGAITVVGLLVIAWEFYSLFYVTQI